jgi:hypothetical protein
VPLVDNLAESPAVLVDYDSLDWRWERLGNIAVISAVSLIIDIAIDWCTWMVVLNW